MNKISKTLDEMFAWNLGAHVMGMSMSVPSKVLSVCSWYNPAGGYEFLMQNCKQLKSFITLC